MGQLWGTFRDRAGIGLVWERRPDSGPISPIVWGHFREDGATFGQEWYFARSKSVRVLSKQHKPSYAATCLIHKTV